MNSVLVLTSYSTSEGLGLSNAGVSSSLRLEAIGGGVLGRVKRLDGAKRSVAGSFEESVIFRTGETYLRQEIHKQYGGQHQTGICTPTDKPYIFLFTGGTGEKRGYIDGWTDDGTFSYSGQGQSGDMAFQRGNAAIRDHAANGKDLHLFENDGNGMVKYLGQMVYGGHQIIPDQVDSKGMRRKVIQFHLVEFSAVQNRLRHDVGPRAVRETPPVYSDAQLFDASNDLATTSEEAKARAQARAAATRAAVLERAAGVCEGCGAAAPFFAVDGEPYLEPHHVRRMTDGGPDDPRFVIALCPNCHRHAHVAADSVSFNDALQQKLAAIALERQQ